MEKAGIIGFVKMRQLEVDEDYSLRGHVLENAIEVTLSVEYSLRILSLIVLECQSFELANIFRHNRK